MMMKFYIIGAPPPEIYNLLLKEVDINGIIL